MESYEYIILGAGPAGLSFALTLKELGINSFLVLEKEFEPGGLCRSRNVDGSPMDIGGGHFLDVKNPDILNFVFKYMPEHEWEKFSRVSRILIRGIEIDYPIEANIWQLSIEDQLDFLESIAQAGCLQQLPMPESFEEWIIWKLGKRIAEEYMLPYNRKIWSIDLNELGTYWLYKLPNVSFRETLQSCIEKKSLGSIPAHDKFLYPKSYGYGEVWKRMGTALGQHLLIGTNVTKIDIHSKVINGCYKGDKIVTSIPWTLWPSIAQIPKNIKDSISKLQYSSIYTDYYSDSLSTNAHWIYDPDEKVEYHRILCRTNFCVGSKGYWTETNSKRHKVPGEWSYENIYAYPLNNNGKPEAIKSINSWAKANDIYPIGRWGLWEHMNSDVTVSNAISEAAQLVKSSQ